MPWGTMPSFSPGIKAYFSPSARKEEKAETFRKLSVTVGTWVMVKGGTSSGKDSSAG